MNLLSDKVRKIVNGRFFTFGLPFMVLMVGGSFGLKYFTSLRYEYRTSVPFKEIAKEAGIKLNDSVSLESEYEKMKNMDIDNWENKRGPRPWEPETLIANKNPKSSS